MNGTETFDFLSNLPLIAFSFAFFIVFVLFIRGGVLLLVTGGDEERVEKGRVILLKALYSLIALLLIVLVFFSVTLLLQKGEVLLPPSTPGDFPPSPDANFPPAPQFIEVGGYYFAGPGGLEDNDFIKKSSVYVILCKKNSEYDIIYIGETSGKITVSKNNQYRCWLNNCNQKLEDIYLAVFQTPLDKYSPDEREKIRAGLESQINPPCPPPLPEVE